MKENKLKKIKKMYIEQLDAIMNKKDCDYSEEEYDEFISELDKKFGIVNLEIDLDCDDVLLNCSNEDIDFIIKRTYEYKYKDFNEYFANTLALCTIEMMFFRNSHSKK